FTKARDDLVRDSSVLTAAKNLRHFRTARLGYGDEDHLNAVLRHDLRQFTPQAQHFRALNEEPGLSWVVVAEAADRIGKPRVVADLTVQRYAGCPGAIYQRLLLLPTRLQMHLAQPPHENADAGRAEKTHDKVEQVRGPWKIRSRQTAYDQKPENGARQVSESDTNQIIDRYEPPPPAIELQPAKDRRLDEQPDGEPDCQMAVLRRRNHEVEPKQESRDCGRDEDRE